MSNAPPFTNPWPGAGRGLVAGTPNPSAPVSGPPRRIGAGPFTVPATGNADPNNYTGGLTIPYPTGSPVVIGWVEVFNDCTNPITVGQGGTFLDIIPSMASGMIELANTSQPLEVNQILGGGLGAGNVYVIWSSSPIPSHTPFANEINGGIVGILPAAPPTQFFSGPVPYSLLGQGVGTGNVYQGFVSPLGPSYITSAWIAPLSSPTIATLQIAGANFIANPTALLEMGSSSINLTGLTIEYPFGLWVSGLPFTVQLVVSQGTCSAGIVILPGLP